MNTPDPFANLESTLDDMIEENGANPVDIDHPRLAPEMHYETCRKCGGGGVFYSFTGRPLGECGACKGKGKRAYKTSRDQRENNRAKANERARNKRVQNWDDFCSRSPKVSAWIKAKAPTFEFAASLEAAVQKYGDLTDNQYVAVKRCMDRDEARKAEAIERAENAPAVELGKIGEAFEAAKASGLKWPKLHLKTFVFSMAGENSKNPGAIYVKDGSEYLGKIIGGKLITVRSCGTEREQAILDIVADPEAAAVAHGVATGSCSCCNRELTNPESIERGIGPICAAKWGW